jgi:hypothetical protein
MIVRKMSAGIWALVVLLSGLGMLGILSVPVVAPPNVHFFSGSITFDALNAPPNTEVFAEIDGTLYGQDSSFGGTGGYDGSVYSLTVSGEDTANATAKEGGMNGEPIIFWVLVPGEPQPYIANQAPVYNDGSVDTLNLQVQSANQPIMVTLNQVAPLNVSDWVELYNPAGASNVDLSADWVLEQSLGGSWGFSAADVLPPLGTSPAPHAVNLLDADSNLKLVWTDPVGTIGAGNPVVMDKIEWGLHLGSAEGTGADTIGLDKGAGSVWDPNLANCVPDEGYRRVVAGVDTDTMSDWFECVPVGPPLQPPELWEPAPGGYLTPVTGDTSTNFVWSVWYADIDNHAPDTLSSPNSPYIDIYSLLTGPLPGSPFEMNFVTWVGANNVYYHPTDGAIFAYQRTMPAGTDWCYVIHATDVSGMSNSTAEFCDPDVGDTTAPEISSVTVNGFENIVVPVGTMVTLNASITDVGYGGSNIAGAEWLFTCGPWPGNTTGPQDLAWDSPTEVGTTVIDTGFGTDGATYRVYVRAWDAVPNYNEDCMVTGNITIDPGGDFFSPNILNPLVDGMAATTVAPGTSVLFTATIDDTARGNNNIGGANYSVDFAPSSPMTAQDLSFDSPMEVAEATIDTTGWTNGAHTVCVAEAWDIIPNYNTLEIECATINIDGQPPGVGSVALDGITVSRTVDEGYLTNLTATVDDTLTGNSNIANASFNIDGGASTPMTAVDLAFDSPTEDVEYFSIDTTGMGGTHTVCVYAADVLGNVYTGTACIELIVVTPDVDPPDISSVLVDGVGSLQIEVGIGTTFDLTAIIDDTIPLTGPSNIQNASYDVRNSTTGASLVDDLLLAGDGSFDSSYEPVQALAVDTTTWPVGGYTIYVYACDVVLNCGWGTSTATIDIVTAILDDEPPVVTNVQADVSSFAEGERTTINITATVDDTGGTYVSNIASANYTLGAAAGDWSGSVVMTAQDGAFDSPTEVVTAEITVSSWTVGTQDIYVYASDAANNDFTDDTASVTITITGGGDPPVVGTVEIDPTDPEEGDRVTVTVTVTDTETSASGLTVVISIQGPGATPIFTNQVMQNTAGTDFFTVETPALTDAGGYSYTITVTDEDLLTDYYSSTFAVEEKPDEPGFDLWIWILLIIIIIVIVALIAFFATRKKPEEEIPEVPLEEELPPEEEFPPEEEAFVEEEVVEEAPPEEVVEEAPPEEVVEEPAPVEEAPMEEAPAEEAPAEEAPVEEEAAPAGPATCPNCGTVNPEGISVCTSCGSPL